MRSILPRLFAVALNLAVVALAASQAEAAPSCAPVRIAAIQLVSYERPVVPAVINGTPVIMLVDTGSEITFVTPETAARLHLKRDPSRRTTTITLGGTQEVDNVTVDKLSLATESFLALDLPVVPLRGAERSPDGLIGADLLHQFDLDIDLPHRSLTLYRPSTCKPVQPPWEPPFETLPMTVSKRLQLMLPTEINGHKMMAIFDTGSLREAISQEAASHIGVTTAELERDIRHKTLGPQSYSLRRHRFDTLVLGPETFRDAWFDVIDFRQIGVDVLIGVDYMAKRRFFVSYANGAMFMQHEVLPLP